MVAETCLYFASLKLNLLLHRPINNNPNQSIEAMFQALREVDPDMGWYET